MHAHHLEINTGLERMVRLNQEINSMLAIAVLRHSALGVASYDTVKGDLQQTMERVAELTKERILAHELGALSESQTQFRELEGEVLELINDDKWDDATVILFGDQYVLARKMYEVDSESAISAVMGELATSAENFAKIRNASLGLRIGALLLLLWVGVMFSRRARVDLAAQMRLRAEISEAYDDMEARVRDRTADLEESSQRLATEIDGRTQSDQRTRLILNSVDEGIFGIDAEERVSFSNEAATASLGYSADEMLGQPIYGLFHHVRSDGTMPSQEDSPVHVACATAQSTKIDGEVLWRKDGSSFPSEYAVTPLIDDKGAVSGAVVVFRDISERSRHQEELQARMDELERFNRLTLSREDRMIQLKKEINVLLESSGTPRKYKDIDTAS